MKGIKKRQQMVLWVISAILVVLAGLTYLVLANGWLVRDNPQVIAAVQTQLTNFYQDEAMTALVDDPDVDQVNQLIEKANQIKAKSNLALKQQVKQLSLQVRDYWAIQSLLQPQETSEDEEDWLLVEGLDLAGFHQVQEGLVYQGQDQIKAQHDAQLEAIQASLTAYEGAQLLIDKVDKAINEANLDQVLLDDWQEVESAYSHLDHHPDGKHIQTNIEATASLLADQVLNLHEQEGLEDQTLDTLNDSPLLMTYLSGTAVDQRRLVALTFDDGPNEEYTTQILDILKEHEVKATFFVMGAYVDDYPHIARRIVEEGHLIGNHTYSHPVLSDLSDEEVLNQINWAQESIYDATGIDTDLFRMPFGRGGARVFNLASDWHSVIWSLDSLDWQLQDAALILEQIESLLGPRNLILMHDTHQATVDAVAVLVPDLLAQGYQFVGPLDIGYDHYYYQE